MTPDGKEDVLVCIITAAIAFGLVLLWALAYFPR